MHILCPHCRNPIDLVKLSAEEIHCPSCGSSFKLETGSTTGWSPNEDHRKIGKFEILSKVGVGAFGTVFKARDPELDRIVAVKVPRAGNLGDGQDLDRFLREARSVAQLRHPGIVSAYDVGQADGVPFLVSDFVNGVTLDDQLTARQMPPRGAAQLIAQVADALQYAHERGVVHRDVKPSNIMLEPNGVVRGKNDTRATNCDSLITTHSPRLMDFGLAKRDAGEITMTVEGQVLGTPAYMSPEQARGAAHKVDGRSDVYSLGVIFYRLLTGELPFRGNAQMLLHQVLHDEPVPPRKLNHRIPRDLETICLKAIAKEPGLRYQTAGALAEEIRRWLKGEPILARPSSTWERLSKWARRRPATAALVAVSSLATLALLVVVSVFVWQLRAAVNETEWRRQQTDEQRQKAEYQADLALEREALARRFWYGADLNLAEQALEAGDGPRLHSVLERQRSQPGWEALRSFEWDYLWQQGHTEKMTLKVSRQAYDDVYTLAYSPDGKALAVTTLEGVHLWDLATGQEQWTRKDLTFAMVLTFSPDGKTLAVGCGNFNIDSKDALPQVHLVDATTGIKRSSFNELVGRVQAMAFSPDGKTLTVAEEPFSKKQNPWDVLANTTPTRLRVWDLASGRDTTVALKIKGWMIGLGSSHATFAPDGKTLALGGGGIELDSMMRSLQKGDSPLGEKGGAVVCLWNAGTEMAKSVLAGNRSLLVSALAFAPDGRAFAVGYLGGRISLWDPDSGKEILNLNGHRRGVTGLSYAPDGKTLASSGKDGDVRLWDVTTGRALATFLGHESAVGCLAYSPDGKTIASGSLDRTVRLWDASARPGPVLLPLTPDTKGFATPATFNSPPFAITSDGKTLVLAQRNQVDLWDPSAGTVRGQLKPGQDANRNRLSVVGSKYDSVSELLLSLDDKRLAVRGHSSIEVWDLPTKSVLSVFPIKRQSLNSPICFTPDGQVLIAQRKLWDVTTGNEATGDLPTELTNAVAFSPDGKTFVTAGEFRQGSLPLTVRDTRIGAERFTLTAVNSFVAFSPDGRTMAASIAPSAESAVGLWDVTTGRQQTILRGHADEVKAVTFSSDGRTVATAGADSSVKLWDPVTGRERMTLRLEDRIPGGVAFASDGLTLVVSWGPPLGNALGAGVLALYQVSAGSTPK